MQNKEKIEKTLLLDYVSRNVKNKSKSNSLLVFSHSDGCFSAENANIGKCIISR